MHMTRKSLISKMPWRYERVIVVIQWQKITKPPLISKRPCIREANSLGAERRLDGGTYYVRAL